MNLVLNYNREQVVASKIKIVKIEAMKDIYRDSSIIMIRFDNRYSILLEIKNINIFNRPF